ncbi:MAG: hypothetical protein L0Y58_02810 [Verrucomicrobia subdivision 3 bacterium]|nr:hypothetical protein [Limisphaerales bacterium]
MKRILISTAALMTLAILQSAPAQGPNPRPASWADCEKFDGIVTPNTLPFHGNFDQLYMMPGFTFSEGVPLISESKPGDQDYNGGRWHLNVLKEGVDPAKYADACSVEQLDLADFEGTGMYFTCPLLPQRN